MLCKIIFDDNTWVEGRRVNFWEMLRLRETKGTHHWIITKASKEYKELMGHRVAIAVEKPRFHVLLKY